MEKSPVVMVVDDEERNLRLMEALLIPLGYEVALFKSGEDALNEVQNVRPDVILLDIMMPGINGFEVVKRLKEDENTKAIPVIMVSALREVEDRIRALDTGADDFLTKPVDRAELQARVRSLLKVKQYNDYMKDYQKKLKIEVDNKTRELRQALQQLKGASLDTIFRLSSAAEYRDEDTAAHIMRMSHYSAAVSRVLGLDEKEVEMILYASPMHDVGKIGIPDRVLLKPGKLDPEEWKIMVQHAEIGARILRKSDSDYIRAAEIIALSHHEKWDGSGYPNGLKGKDIPREGRIVAIADVFDALTSRRPYKEPFSVEKSFGILREGRGSHFDPDVVDAFFSIEGEVLSIKERYRDRGESILFQLATENGNSKKS